MRRQYSVERFMKTNTTYANLDEIGSKTKIFRLIRKHQIV